MEDELEGSDNGSGEVSQEKVVVIQMLDDDDGLGQGVGSGWREVGGLQRCFRGRQINYSG